MRGGEELLPLQVKVTRTLWDALEAHRVAGGHKDRSEATRDLLRRGLEASRGPVAAVGGACACARPRPGPLDEALGAARCGVCGGVVR